METSDWIAVAALLFAVVTFFLNRRALRDERADRKKQIDLVRQGEAREASAHLVIENLRGRADNAEALFVFGVRNVGRAAARNVRLEAEQPQDKNLASAWSVAERNLRAALAPGAVERASLRFARSCTEPRACRGRFLGGRERRARTGPRVAPPDGRRLVAGRDCSR
jgi:hypothetical protein